LVADVVVCTGADVVVGGLGGGATAVDDLGAGAGGAVDRTGAGAVVWPPLLAAAVVWAVTGAEEEPAADPEAEADGESDAVPDWLAPALPVDCGTVGEVLAVFAGAERTKIVTKAATASALSCVVRQVSLRSRRRPSSRPPSSNSSCRTCLHPSVQLRGRAAVECGVARLAHGGQHTGPDAKTHLRSH
jgi:hypothetical protein